MNTAFGLLLTREFKPPPGVDQQREAGAGLLVADADVALVIKRHGSLSLPRFERRPISEAIEYHLCKQIVYCVSLADSLLNARVPSDHPYRKSRYGVLGAIQ